MSSATILVIEDNPITRKMVRVALHSDGYAVLEAPDGRTALDLMARQTPDLILHDLLLPDMDTFDLVQQLRALPGGGAVPILAVSGFLSKMEQARSLQAGFTDYLFKPVEPSHLLRTVRAYLRPASAADGKPGRARRVLVADDDLIQGKLLKIHLEQLGFEVVPAADGLEALEKARVCPPDAIISDVLMPHLDGFQLCLAVRQDPRLAGVPLLLTSAVYTEEADRHLAQSVGASAFLLRSSDNREVTEALLACLGRDARPVRQSPAELPIEEYTHRVIRQLEQQMSLSANLTRRLALLEAELGILARIVETLKDPAAAESVLGELLHRCLDAAGISRGAAYLREADGRLSLRARLGYPDAMEGALADYFGHTELLRQVIERGEPMQVSACTTAGAHVEDLLAKLGAKSILIAPLVVGEDCLGVLEMASASRELGEDWLSFAKAVASQVAQALELARTLSRLSTSEESYRELIQDTGAIVWEADLQAARFTFVSQGAEKILGYPVARWLEERDWWASLIHPDDRARTIAHCRKAVAEGRDHELEYRMVAAGGDVVWVHDTVRVVRDAQGRPRQLRGLMVDVTERRQVEEHGAKIALAHEIQQRFFPASPPRLAGFEIGGASYPAEATGGDYYDYIPMPDGCVAIATGDVAGHSFGPALLMAEARAYLRALLLTRTDVGEILTVLNQALANDMGEDSFITLLLARLDAGTRSFYYASAGHTTAYILDPSGAVRAALHSTDIPLGIYADRVFATSERITLEPGDLVLCLTDGIPEARAPDSTPFGTERALKIVRLYRNDPPHAIVENLYHAVRSFSQNQPQDDDITAVVIKVEPAGPAPRSCTGRAP